MIKHTSVENNREQYEATSQDIAIDSRGRLQLGGSFFNQYLTKRELDVLKAVIHGYSAKQTSRLLGISNRTVEKFIDKLKDKFACHKKSEMVFIAIKNGFIQHLVC